MEKNRRKRIRERKVRVVEINDEEKSPQKVDVTSKKRRKDNRSYQRQKMKNVEVGNNDNNNDDLAFNIVNVELKSNYHCLCSNQVANFDPSNSLQCTISKCEKYYHYMCFEYDETKFDAKEFVCPICAYDILKGDNSAVAIECD